MGLKVALNGLYYTMRKINMNNTVISTISIEIPNVDSLFKYSVSDIKNLCLTKQGIYFLFDYYLEDDSYELIYIGQSGCLKKRLHEHYLSGKGACSFTYYSYVEMSNLGLRLLHETAYIYYYKPELNILGISNIHSH